MSMFEITSLISKVVWTTEDADQIVQFIKGISKNKHKEIDFFDYCNQWKLAPWVFTQLSRQDLMTRLSNETQKIFRETHEKITIENERRNKEAVRFLAEFKKKNIEVVVLKGNLFAHYIYKDVGYKKMNDFDILIHQQDWGKIQDIYMSLGYIPLGFGWSGEKQKAAKFSHVGMSFISPDFSCIIGSQWGLKSPTTKYKINMEDAWQTAIEFDFFGVKVKQLSPEYNLLHLILHMGVFKCGVRDCMDVYNLLLSEKINTHLFYEIIEKSNCVDKTCFTLSLSNICSNSCADLLLGIKPNYRSFIMRRLKKRVAAYDITKDIHESYNDYFQDIEKVVIYFNLFPAFHKKLWFYLIILKHIFYPKTEITLKLSDSASNRNTLKKIRARITAPYFVFSLIAQEIGWKFTFLLFLKLFIDLIFSLKNYIVKKDSYFDYLKKRGVDPKSIEKAVKNIQ